MKKIKWLVAFLIVANLLLGVIGCKDPEIHIHTYSEAWTSDANGHWHEATCEHTTEVSGKAEHTFGDWKVTQEPTEEAEGTKERSCTVCEYTVPEVIEKLEHKHKFSEEWAKDETNHWHAATCGHTTEVSEKAEHSFGDWTVTKEATCTEEGSKAGVCEVCKKEVTKKIDAKGHCYGEYVSNNDATKEADGTKTRECSVCGHKDTVTDEGSKIHVHTFAESLTKDETHHWYAATCGHEVTEGKAAHSFGDWTITKEPTEEAEGSREKSCTVCEYTVPEVIEKLEHKHKFASEWTSDETNHWHASTCGHEVTEGKAAHTFGGWTTTKEATCTQEGKETVYCTVCEYEKEETIPAKGHSRIWEITKEPTVTKVGQMQSVCEVCGETVTKELQPAPQGFRFVKGGTITGTESWTPSSSVFVSGRCLTIPDLIVSDHEVTRDEYRALMGSDLSWASAYDKDGNELEGDDVLNNPVNGVNWYDALVYCNKRSMAEGLTPCYSIKGSTNPDTWGAVPTLSNSIWNAVICNWNANGYRLPTEAEWEWLARGGENYIYAGSDNVDDVAWYTSNPNDTGTREVKTKAPNGYGLYDMSGNVFEWCWDWYASISSSSAADGITAGYSRVLRGGSFYGVDGGCQVAYRVSCSPSYRNGVYGFRVVRPSSK